VPDDELFQQRRQKVDELAALGVPAYNVDFRPTHTAEQALAELEKWEKTVVGEEHEGPDVAVAGRIMQYRLQGKSCFVHMEDGLHRIQVWFKLDVLGEEQFKVVELLEMGDIVGIEGSLMRTRRGEPTVVAKVLKVLVKALRPLPEKFHGLQDTETKYRKRYLDLVSSVDQRRHFAERSRIISGVRSVLDAHDFLEVETPILQTLAGGAEARPFETHWNALNTDVVLRISLELHLKRLLVGGYPKVYEIGRVFRNEGLSPRHNPEFTMLEAYAAYQNYDDIRLLTEEIVVAAAGSVLTRVYAGREFDLTPPFRVAKMVDLIKETCDFDPMQAWEKGTLSAEAASRSVEVKETMGPGAIFAEIYETCVEPTLWNPTFVLDFPIEVSPLSRKSKEDPRFADRFNLVICGREVADAWSELNDPIDQRARFEEQMKLRAAGDLEAHQLDEDFLEAIETGMPPAGGLGVGIDRLMMFLTDSPSIRDVLLFPTMRPRDSD
jgi:lysyl-tRNA synthetase class 2